MTDELTYQDLEFPIFCNSRVLGSVGGTDVTVEDYIHAALVSRSNLLLIGNRGTGKTRAARDILDHDFGGLGMFAEGRPDFKLDELLTRVNLGKLREAKSTEDILELTEQLTYRLFFIDEINRCPEITQNQFFSFANGYYLHRGKPIPLGNKGYAIAFSTANVGNGEFSGTFRMDSALLDRWHAILDLDYWRKTPEDRDRIHEKKQKLGKDAKYVQAPCRDISDKIVAAYKSIGDPSDVMQMIAQYLAEGLDYCETFPAAEHSKRVLASRFSVICHEKSCTKRESACGIAKPLEERAVENIVRMAQGIEYIARLKDPHTKNDPVNSMLIAYKVIAPHTRVLSQQYINSDENFSNPSFAGVHAAEKIREDVQDIMGDGPVFRAYIIAKYGEDTTQIDALDKKYDYLKPFLRGKANEPR